MLVYATGFIIVLAWLKYEVPCTDVRYRRITVAFRDTDGHAVRRV